MLKKFTPEKVVCIDDTHGTNAYNLHLTTLMVLDELEEGFAAGWFISNNTDTSSMQIFFNAIKINVGEVSPSWFMSDDANQFYNAWSMTFESKPKKLLCTWQVLRAWRQHLKLINNTEKEETIYQTLKMLVDETNQNKFSVMLENAVTAWKLDNDTKDFAIYFENNYKCRVSQWASSYRTLCGLNTNMYVEAFHHVLKYNFLRGKHNKRIDALIYALFEYLRFKSFDRLIKVEKGKITGRLALIQKRHKASQKLSFDLVSSVDPVTWKVKSEEAFNIYTVEKQNKCCSDNCPLKCTECNILCAHIFLYMSRFTNSLYHLQACTFSGTANWY